MGEPPSQSGIDYSKFDGLGSSSEDEGHHDHAGQCPCCTQRMLLGSAGLDPSIIPPEVMNGAQQILNKSEPRWRPILVSLGEEIRS